MKKLIAYAFLSLLLFPELHSQELNCNFSINTSRLPGTNKQIFETLTEAVRDYMNNTIWTNQVFEANERIECNILLDITEDITADEYKATLQIQARRPVYGSSYNTVLFNYKDEDFQFRYQEFDAIEFSENNFISNLSSVLTFYAYYIIGLDYDSFSPKGGTPYFEKAEKIVNAAQSSNYSGWKSSDSDRRKNRYWLVENILDSDYDIIRDFNYFYHRHGLDLMEKSVDLGRRGAYESVIKLERFVTNKPDPFMSLLQVLIDSKSDEIVNVFLEAPADQKQKILNIMLKVDPAGGRKYEQLKKN